MFIGKEIEREVAAAELDGWCVVFNCDDLGTRGGVYEFLEGQGKKKWFERDEEEHWESVE